MRRSASALANAWSGAQQEVIGGCVLPPGTSEIGAASSCPGHVSLERTQGLGRRCHHPSTSHLFNHPWAMALASTSPVAATLLCLRALHLQVSSIRPPPARLLQMTRHGPASAIRRTHRSRCRGGAWRSLRTTRLM